VFEILMFLLVDPSYFIAVDSTAQCGCNLHIFVVDQRTNSDQCNFLLQVEEKQTSGTFDKFWF
jgi:predicted nucleic acid-binding Zn finger protein